MIALVAAPAATPAVSARRVEPCLPASALTTGPITGPATGSRRDAAAATAPTPVSRASLPSSSAAEAAAYGRRSDACPPLPVATCSCRICPSSDRNDAAADPRTPPAAPPTNVPIGPPKDPSAMPIPRPIAAPPIAPAADSGTEDARLCEILNCVSSAYPAPGCAPGAAAAARSEIPAPASRKPDPTAPPLRASPSAPAPCTVIPRPEVAPCTTSLPVGATRAAGGGVCASSVPASIRPIIVSNMVEAMRIIPLTMCRRFR